MYLVKENSDFGIRDGEFKWWHFQVGNCYLGNIKSNCCGQRNFSFTTYLGGFHSYRVWVDTVLKMGLTTEIHKLVNYRVLCLLFDNLMVVTQVKWHGLPLPDMAWSHIFFSYGREIKLFITYMLTSLHVFKTAGKYY